MAQATRVRARATECACSSLATCFVTWNSLLLISLSTALKATMSLLFTLTKDAVTVKLKPTQMRTETIGKIFNLESDSIFLIGDDGTVATAEDGNFNSFEMESDVGWTVSGNTVSTAINLQQPKLSLSSSSSSKWKPVRLLSLLCPRWKRQEFHLKESRS